MPSGCHDGPSSPLNLASWPSIEGLNPQRSGMATGMDATADGLFLFFVRSPIASKTHVFPLPAGWLPANVFQPLLDKPPFQTHEQIPTTALDAQRFVLLLTVAAAAVVLRHGRAHGPGCVL